MSSVTEARNLTESIGELLAPNMPAKVKYDLIYRELSKLLSKDIRERFTKRRVRSLHNGEVRRVDYEEMRALKELQALEEARHERLKLAATANRLAVLLAKEGAPLDRRQLAALRRLAGGSNCSGASGAVG